MIDLPYQLYEGDDCLTLFELSQYKYVCGRVQTCLTMYMYLFVCLAHMYHQKDVHATLCKLGP